MKAENSTVHNANRSDEQKAVLSIHRDISEYKQMENDLRERERHLLSVTNSAKDAIVSADNRGNIIFWNEGARKIFGYDDQEVVGKPLSILMPEKYREAHAKGMRRYTETGEKRVIGQTVELHGLRKDGTEFPLELSLGVWETTDGKYFTGIMRDITERQTARKLLEESEQRYRYLGEGIKHQVWTSSPDGKLDYVNQRTAEYFGRTNEEIIGESWQEVIHPDDLPTVIERWTKSLETGADYEIEFRLKRKDGEYLWHLGRATAGFDDDGNIIKWFGTNTDIDDKKTFEKTQRESEEKFRSFIETTKDWIWEIDADGNSTYNNPAIEAILGYTPEELDGKSFLPFMFAEDSAEIERVFPQFIAEKRGWINLVCRWRHKDGDIRYLESSSVPIFDDGGEVVGFRGTDHDITERKRAAEELQESETRYRRLFENNPNPIWVYDVETLEFLAVNEEAVNHYGYSREEFSKLTLKDVRPPEDVPLLQNYTEQADSGVEKFSSVRHRKKDGSIIQTDIAAQHINFNGRRARFALITDITERKRIEEQLLHDAFHDGLTGLANRALFMDHLQRAIERGKSRHSNFYAVLFLDFDRFKFINDSLGHSAGDNFLKLVARRLEHSTRTGDIVARLGGDEFVVLLSEMLETDDAIRVVERIQEDLKKPFELDGREIFATASIGITYSTAGHTLAEDMLRDADIAMYDAKAKGRAQYRIFDKEMHNRATKRLQIETEMRLALEREEFRAHYQPIIDIETNNLMGFESLIRWQHPERGMIPPFDFIPVAEENNLILPIGNWILRESCRQLREWQTIYPAAENLTVSVNLSSKEFLQIDLAEQINETLRETGLKPQCLKLEITESHLMENSELAVKIMNRLCALGIQLSLDDFGTGYSSLSYLHRLPVSFLKIDRSFVMRMEESKENEEIVYTIIKLAQNLKMQVIAEGIETAEQLARLKHLKCEYGQGYFFSKPLEAEKAEDFIKEHGGKPAFVINEQVLDMELSM